MSPGRTSEADIENSDCDVQLAGIDVGVVYRPHGAVPQQRKLPEALIALFAAS